MMQCYQLYARMKLNKKEFLLEDIRSIWLTGKSLPSQCDQPFEMLYKSGLVTNELVWKRFRLSMQNNEIGLATYLSRRLNTELKVLARKWIQIHKNPYKHTRKPNIYIDTLRIVKTPALTTATACNSALTGVGATIALGSHLWNGIKAALPIPKANKASNKPVVIESAFPDKIPPGVKSRVPAKLEVQRIAGIKNNIEVPSKIIK